MVQPQCFMASCLWLSWIFCKQAKTQRIDKDMCGGTHTHTQKIPIQPYQTWHENEYIFMANSWIVCSKADKMSTKVDRHQQVVISKKEPMI